jgi:hypothetical protein
MHLGQPRPKKQERRLSFNTAAAPRHENRFAAENENGILNLPAVGLPPSLSYSPNNVSKGRLLHAARSQAPALIDNRVFMSGFIM